MNEIELHNYNLEKTLLGGQSFNWDLIDGTFYGFFVDKVVKLKQEENKLYWQTYPEKDNFDFIKQYLRLGVDYNKILTQINKDEWVDASIKKYPNLRILKQDFDQTLISYIISANNNINSIRRIVRNLSRSLGKQVTVDNLTFNLFPSVESIAQAPLETLLETKAGYRARYLKDSAQKLFVEGQKLSNNEDEIIKWLLEFPGIGEKVADAILQYSLGFDNVTPLDVWVQRILIDLYLVDSKANYKKMRAWLQSYFNGYAGWAGQFLYEYYRNEYKFIKSKSLVGSDN
ncbi:hypothetical protein DOJK_01095 [Patescibacteria group bacterium]|nr:hypothetical protein DOJK_01095 [Patescibacteria group bacterium]